MTTDTKSNKPQAKKPAAKPAAKPKLRASAKPAGGAYGGMADMMNAGALSGLADNSGNDFSQIEIAEIFIKAQVRKIMEDDENSLQDLADSIRERGLLQPIVVRPIPGPIPFELVAGERRLRASMLLGHERIGAMVRQLTDEQAEAVQFAENVQRKNLTQIEIAERLQVDLDALDGDVEALIAKHQKSRAWISKWLSILDLTPQAQRVIDENVSADLEVINTVKQVEKVDPKAAEKLVDELKETQGKKNARKQATAAKEAVKPSKKPPKEQPKPPAPENVAGAIDRSHQEHGPVTTPTLGDVAPETFEALQQQAKKEEGQQLDQGKANQEQDDQHQGKQHQDEQHQDEQDSDIFADAKTDTNPEERSAPALPPAEALHKAYVLISEDGAAPKMVLDCMDKAERDDCENWLHAFYDAGAAAKDLSSTVIQGFRTGNFSTEGHGAFALSAFLYGSDTEAKFNMLNIMGSVKA